MKRERLRPEDAIGEREPDVEPIEAIGRFTRIRRRPAEEQDDRADEMQATNRSVDDSRGARAACVSQQLRKVCTGPVEGPRAAHLAGDGVRGSPKGGKLRDIDIFDLRGE